MKVLIFLSLLLNCVLCFGKVTSQQLAQETEKLYLKLEKQSPVRPTMALRLADLNFDSAVEIDQNGKFTAREMKEVENLKRRSLDLYGSVLTGFDGAYAKPPVDQKMRVQFQMARIYSDLGQATSAEKLWKELSAQKQDPKIQREASLRLAEKFENSDDPKELLEAQRLYDLALKTSDKKDLLSYVSYRRGWVSHRRGQSTEGLKFLTQALENSDSASIQEILNDFILFVARSNWSFSQAMEKVEAYSEKYSQPQLSEKLVDAYYLADQREKYNQGLVYLDQKSPRLDRLISQIEFQYSEKKMKEVNALIEKLNRSMGNGVGFTSESKKAESEKTLYRLIVEWDGERKNNSEFTTPFNEGVLSFTQLFPASLEFQKIVEGWLVVEAQVDRKFQQLKNWAEMQMKLKNVTAEMRLRKLRLALAGQQKSFSIIHEETKALALLTQQPAEARDLKYQSARAYYDSKDYQAALPLFQELAQVSSSPSNGKVFLKPDQIAIFSQNLALDILAQQKEYLRIQAQVQSWTNLKDLQSFAKQDAEFAKELTDMTGILEKAQFELAIQDKNEQSLKLFTEFCLKGKIQPQSCENAKKLAVELKDQSTLIAVLKHLGKEEELVAELEFGGYFNEAAQLYERQLKSSSKGLSSYFHIALLYELAGQMKDRDRVLLGAVATSRKSKSSLTAAEEELLYLALKDAGLLTTDLLSFPWSASLGKKEVLAFELETAKKGNSQTRQILLKTCQDLGSLWTQLHLKQLRDLNDKQQKIQFYGNNSLKKFQSRVSALKNLGDSSQCFIKGTASQSRRAAVHFQISSSYLQFAKAIEETPIPEGVEGEMLEQVKAQVHEMALPFHEQSQAWKKQAESYWEQVSSEDKKGTDISGNWNFEYSETSAPKLATLKMDWAPLVQKLRKNPYEKSVVSDIRQQLEANGQVRLAAYFKGREKNLVSGESL